MLVSKQQLRRATSVTSSAHHNTENMPKSTTLISSIDLKEEIKSLQSQINPNVKYDIRINGMRRMISLINNGILQYQEFLNALPFFHAGLVSSISNSRNSSTKIACKLISQLVTELHEQFDSLGNFMRPLASQYAIRIQIIADCCSESMLTISKFCCTKKTLVQLAGLCTSRNPKIRLSASKCLFIFITSASVEVLEDGWYIMSKSLRALLNDPNMEIKANTKKAAKQLLSIAPNHYQEILSYFNMNLQKQASKEKNHYPGKIDNNIQIINLSSRDSNDTKNNNSFPLSNIDYKNSKHGFNNYDEIHTITKDSKNQIDGDNTDNSSITESNSYTDHDRANEIEIIESHSILAENRIDDNLNVKKEIISIGKTNYVLIDSDNSSSSDKPDSISNINQSSNNSTNENQSSEFFPQSLIKEPQKSSNPKYSTLGSISKIENFQNTKKDSRRPAPSPVSSQKRSSDTDIFSPIQKIALRCSSVNNIRLRTTPLINPSIRQANGHGKSFLDNLRIMVERNDTTEISDIISGILDDVIKCCSLPILSVSAISVLRLLLSHFHSAFEGKLTQLIPILLTQGAKGSKRASENAMQLLQELFYYFPPSLLAKATVYSPPSPRLSSFGAMLVDYPTDELFNDANACQCLLYITLDSYLFDIKSSGHILDVIYKMRPDYVKQFFSKLSDKQLYSYQKHFKDSHPDIDFPPPRPVKVPNFPNINIEKEGEDFDDNYSNIIFDWADSFIAFVEGLHSFQWKMVHTQVFKEINKIMLLKNKCTSSIFELTMYLFQKRGFEDIVIILSGIFKNLRGEVNSKKAQKILLQYFRYCDTLTVFTEFTVIMVNNDLEIALNAIDFSILLLKSIEKEILLPILPEFTLSLSKLLSNERPEIRKGAVLCFVSIFSITGRELIDQYSSCLTQAQLKLIIIYLERSNRQNQNESSVLQS